VVKQIDSNPLVMGSFLSRESVQDSLFLIFIMLLSVILYIEGLGFYSDDWAFLSLFSLSRGQSLIRLLRVFFSQTYTWTRPIPTFCDTTLYWLFGQHPFGYHLVNAIVLMTGIVLFYLSLRELNLNRLLALAIPMVYGLLPHYSTTRFWYATFGVNLSMTLYFLSLYSDLRMLRVRPSHVWRWKFCGVVGLLGSTLAYEVFVPLLFLNLLVVYFRRRELQGSDPTTGLRGRRLSTLLGVNVVALILVILFKVLVTTRLGNYPGFLEQIRYLAGESIRVSYRQYGSGLPRLVWGIVYNYPDTALFGLGAVFGLIVFGYLYRVAGQSKTELPKPALMLKLIGVGFVVFGLGYAVFLATFRIGFSPTGADNRLAIAAAVGVALSQVGGLGFLSSVFHSQKLKRFLFSIGIALLSTSGFLITNTIASFWTSAYGQQLEILADIRQHVLTLPAGTTLLLDGVCPYNGPGIVFESPWDLTGALSISYDDPSIRADIVTPKLRVREDGISTTIYSHESFYPYKQLLIYHFGQKKAYQLTDKQSALAYFAKFNPDHSSGCPKGHEGGGVPIF
jgi:hypothetical protein